MRVAKTADPSGKGGAFRVREAEQKREPGRVADLADRFTELSEQPAAPMRIVSRDVYHLGRELGTLTESNRPRQHAHAGGRFSCLGEGGTGETLDAAEFAGVLLLEPGKRKLRPLEGTEQKRHHRRHCRPAQAGQAVGVSSNFDLPVRSFVHKSRAQILRKYRRLSQINTSRCPSISTMSPTGVSV